MCCDVCLFVILFDCFCCCFLFCFVAVCLFVFCYCCCLDEALGGLEDCFYRPLLRVRHFAVASLNTVSFIVDEQGDNETLATSHNV